MHSTLCSNAYFGHAVIGIHFKIVFLASQPVSKLRGVWRVLIFEANSKIKQEIFQKWEIESWQNNCRSKINDELLIMIMTELINLNKQTTSSAGVIPQQAIQKRKRHISNRSIRKCIGQRKKRYRRSSPSISTATSSEITPPPSSTAPPPIVKLIKIKIKNHFVQLQITF